MIGRAGIWELKLTAEDDEAPEKELGDGIDAAEIPAAWDSIPRGMAFFLARRLISEKPWFNRGPMSSGWSVEPEIKEIKRMLDFNFNFKVEED